MTVRRPFLSFLALFCTLATHAFADTSFENTAIVRTVELGGSLVHVRTTYAVRALEEGARVYTFALGKDEEAKTNFKEVRVKGQQEALQLQSFEFSPKSNAFLFTVELSKPLGLNGTANIELETVQTHATYPWPAAVGQDEEQALKYESDLFVISPYHTVIQRTKIRSSSPKIISFTSPEEMDAFTLDSPATKSGATVTYGPYNNIAPSSTLDFTTNSQRRVTVYFKHDDPVLEVTKLQRTAEISHWGANLNIQDEIYLHNAGPELRGHFSRLAHQQQTYHRTSAPHSLRGLTLHLPAGIRDAYFYDLVGNVSTSNLRIAPSVPKGATAKQFSILELRPRYPIMGGWNYSFTLGWDAPLEDSASWNAREGKYIVAVPIMTLLNGVVINEAELKIILPEGATDVEVFPPFPPKSSTLSTHVTYLDTTGRPAVTFEYSQLTDRHAGIVYVTYKVPFSAHMRKPLAVATAFFAVFTLALAARRVDGRIHKK